MTDNFPIDGQYMSNKELEAFLGRLVYQKLTQQKYAQENRQKQNKKDSAPIYRYSGRKRQANR